MNFKKVTAIALTSVLITGSATALANASSTKNKDMRSMASAKSKYPGSKDKHVHIANRVSVITTTLGIDAATLKSRLAAGESLAVIAGAKKDALVTALIAEHTKQIDARLAAGKLTADQAKSMKDALADHVNKEINRVRTGDKLGHHDGDDHDENHEGNHKDHKGHIGHMGYKGKSRGSNN